MIELRKNKDLPRLLIYHDGVILTHLGAQATARAPVFVHNGDGNCHLLFSTDFRLQEYAGVWLLYVAIEETQPSSP